MAGQDKHPGLNVEPRYLLSPLPSSQTQTLPSHTKALGSGPLDAITLYPLEAVPTHLLCVICTLPYENPVHFLPCCHVFCLECIQLWIGMNLGDDLLQNELQRAYPAEGDVSQRSLQQQGFTIELEQMSGGHHSRSGTSNSHFDDTLDSLTPDQRLYLQQQRQQAVAAILETRDMPQCPMCRTGLHVHAWDRIEEQIRVPVSVTPQQETFGFNVPPPSWPSRGGPARQRPVSGVERRQMRSDRFLPGASQRLRHGRRHENVIGEDVEAEAHNEEIEMEHVRSTSTTGLRPYLPSSSTSSSSQESRLPAPTVRSQHYSQHSPTSRPQPSLLSLSEPYSTWGENDLEEQESPMTAVIGRRPSEWMRYQQQQIQAHQAQISSTRQLSNQTQNVGMRSPPSRHRPMASISTSLQQQQEQIRRLFLEQESQEQLLRDLGAYSANDPGDGPGALAQGQNSSTLNRRYSEQASEVVSLSDPVPDASSEVSSTLQYRSTLQIDTTTIRTRSSTYHSNSDLTLHESLNHIRSVSQDQGESHSRLVVAEEPSEEGAEFQNDGADRTLGDSEEIPVPLNPNDVAGDEVESESSILDMMQQGTRAWAELSVEPEGPFAEPSQESEEELNVSDSVSDSTRSSAGSPEPSLRYSATDTSAASPRPSLTSSLPLQSRSSGAILSSERSSMHPSWDRYSNALQMPTWDGVAGVDESENEENTLRTRAEESDVDAGSQVWDERRLSHPRAKHTDMEDRNTNAESNCGEQEMASGTSTHGDSSSLNGGANAEPSASTSSQYLHSTSLNWGGSSGVSPVVQELGIHHPIMTAEGSVTTIADMQIDADRLARTRTSSILSSDDDISSAQDMTMPMDSPILTPSTARPRRRFPTGIALLGNHSDSERDPEVSDHGEDKDNLGATHEGSLDSYLQLDVDILGRELDSSSPVLLPDQQDTTIDEDAALEGAFPELTDTLVALVNPLPSPQLESLDFESVSEDRIMVTEGESSADATVRESRSTETNPLDPTPSLPSDLLLPVTLGNVEQESIPTHEVHDDNEVVGMTENELVELQVNEESALETPTSNPPIRRESSSSPSESPSSIPTTAAEAVAPPSPSPSFGPSQNDEPTRVKEIIQYRTVVRFQPRLPKAHVMSDLISQVRVECPHRTYGCPEAIEMQRAHVHSRDQCQFRMVKCPRARCGLWMRADQILEHILMVEAAPTASTMTVSSSLLQSGVDKSSMSRMTQSGFPRPSTRSNRQPEPLSSTAIPPCPGLTWEREQLARATGIIGQLTEENTSLRQSIRQLTVKNTQLLKDKDRWQRYADLGWGRRD